MRYSRSSLRTKILSFFRTRLIFRKNSIFTKIFIPVIVVMVFQTSIIGLSLFINGTIDTLDSGAVDVLSKNAENRAAALEREMVAFWSNLDKLDIDVMEHINGYLTENDMDISEAWGDYAHETAMLDEMSQSLIDAMRTSGATGMFAYFLNPSGYEEEGNVYNGLYYRDLNPLTNPADSSDILYERGNIEIARKDKIQLDSLWNETFSFTPEDENTWRGFVNPQIAAERFPGALPIDLAYWNAPHLLNSGSSLESSECITYTRPFFYEGRLIAVIGTEIQTAQMENYFPASDFDSYGQSGYMLLKYDTNNFTRENFSAEVLQVTGSYISRLIAPQDIIELTAVEGSHEEGVSYNISSNETESVRVVFHPLHLYNANAPFSNEQWVLAAIGTENMLFEASHNLSHSIFFSSLLAALVGGIILTLAIRRSTRPIISIANQLEKSDNDYITLVSRSNAYEITLLASTINAARERRRLAEAQVREERERYLTALESATDTFIEYDLREDVFMLYFFRETDGNRAALSSRSVPNFTETVSKGGFCHRDDIQSLIRFIRLIQTDPIEIRIRTSVFLHITEVTPDGDYYWFLLKASASFGEDGNANKIIGTAKEITNEKLEEAAASEVRRRDLTTGAYNRSYGESLIKDSLAALKRSSKAFLSVFHIGNFDRMETFYGRVFAGLVMYEFGLILRTIVPENTIIVRMANEEFLLFNPYLSRKEVNNGAERISKVVQSLYSGESKDVRLHVHMGTAEITNSGNQGKSILFAATAMNYSKRINTVNEYYEDMPPQERGNIFFERAKPVNIFLDIKHENIVSLTFELFERTSDVNSAVKVLLILMGRLFGLNRIVVCAYDEGFGTNQVLHEWSKTKVTSGGNIEKLSPKDWAAFTDLLDKNDNLFFTAEDSAGFDEGIRELLCIPPGENTCGYCCEMLENESHTGRVMFFGEECGRPDDKKQVLHEIVKIIAVHMSIEKSHSASRAKSEFLSRISHEIRTPMSAIIGMTDIALNSGGDQARVNDALNKIDFSAKHLLALINDVLEMSRIESGKLQIEEGAFSLDAFTDGINTLMRMPIENKGITFTVKKTLRHRDVFGDEYRLRQVIVNLLGNANKFTKAGGTIILSIQELEEPAYETEEGSAYFRFSVKDTGIGISLEEHTQVFKAFEQAGSDSIGRHNGTGLGLAISANIISAMGGKIELESELGEGSDFYFTIKLKIAADNAETGPEDETAFDYTGAFTGKRALLVEDVDINVEIASYILEQTGIEIDVASNGQEAVDRFLSSPAGYYDAILMDIQMPVMDGLTAAKHIRRSAEKPEAGSVPIIAMTANAFDEDMKKSVESGMNGHVAKPLDSEKLFEVLYKVIFNKKTEDVK